MIFEYRLTKRFYEALRFAEAAHEGQYRECLNPEIEVPYIAHPVRVCNLLIENGVLEREDFEEILIAAVLHDVIEDTRYTEKDLEELFGKTAATLVAGLTNVPRPEQVARVKAGPSVENLIRCADKLANLMDIEELFLEMGPIPKDYQNWIDGYTEFVREIGEAIGWEDEAAVGLKKEILRKTKRVLH